MPHPVSGLSSSSSGQLGSLTFLRGKYGVWVLPHRTRISLTPSAAHPTTTSVVYRIRALRASAPLAGVLQVYLECQNTAGAPHRTRRAAWLGRDYLRPFVPARDARAPLRRQPTASWLVLRACTLQRGHLYTSLRVRAYTRAGQRMWPVSRLGGVRARSRMDVGVQIVVQMVADYSLRDLS